MSSNVVSDGDRSTFLLIGGLTRATVVLEKGVAGSSSVQIDVGSAIREGP